MCQTSEERFFLHSMLKVHMDAYIGPEILPEHVSLYSR